MDPCPPCHKEGRNPSAPPAAHSVPTLYPTPAQAIVLDPCPLSGATAIAAIDILKARRAHSAAAPRTTTHPPHHRTASAPCTLHRTPSAPTPPPNLLPAPAPPGVGEDRTAFA